MRAQLGPSDYLAPYVERLYAARHSELQAMTPEMLLATVGEALEVVCATEIEIEIVAAGLRDKLRDDAPPARMLANDEADPLLA